MYRNAGKFMRNIHLTQFSRQLLSEKKNHIFKFQSYNVLLVNNGHSVSLPADLILHTV